MFLARAIRRVAQFLARDPNAHEWLIAAGFSETALAEDSKRSIKPNRVRV